MLIFKKSGKYCLVEKNICITLKLASFKEEQLPYRYCFGPRGPRAQLLRRSARVSAAKRFECTKAEWQKLTEYFQNTTQH